MRVKINIDGHQFHSSVEGEVLLWCAAVEGYSLDDKVQYQQVPAVIIRTQDAVEVVTLQRHGYWTKIDVLAP